MTTDHKGNTYPHLCHAQSLEHLPACLRARRRYGWSIEAALTAPVEKSPVTDHRGFEYPTIKVMCTAYSIPESTCLYRRKKGMSVEETLIKPAGGKQGDRKVKGHKGRAYCSEARMCKAYGVKELVSR